MTTRTVGDPRTQENESRKAIVTHSEVTGETGVNRTTCGTSYVSLTRGIQQAYAALVGRLNELAHQYRENKAEIDDLRWQLSGLRKPVRS